jgi:trimethylamine--corrinoid protein Co-methyltransferase
MNATIQVLREDDCAQIHERSLSLLRDTGVEVKSERARKILGGAGAEVEGRGTRVRFPPRIVEHALKLAPKRFTLGARRAGWDLDLNTGKCWLCADGGAVSVLDYETKDLRPGTLADWTAATRLIDALDELGIYWSMIEGGFDDTQAGFVEYWTHLLRSCSKHMQDSVDSVEKARLLLEILEIAFGGREDIRLKRPFSYVLCPMSPLVIDRTYTDAYLETVGWELPVAIMPMPLMGATAPASLISTLLVANADFLATLCMVQAAGPGTPVIYAAVPQSVEPHTWRYTGGALENSILNAAAAQLGRYYHLPVEIGAGGTDHHFPGIQASYERAVNWVLPAMVWPDILVGPGLLGGSTVLSLEQMMIDVEIFRRCRRLREGIPTLEQDWLDEIIHAGGPGGSFVAQRSTLGALRNGTFYLGGMGFHDTFEKWKAAGRPDVDQEIHHKMQETLMKHQPLPLDPAVNEGLERLASRMRAANQ